eukprot:2678466-Amphidinium_carterae.1
MPALFLESTVHWFLGQVQIHNSGFSLVSSEQRLASGKTETLAFREANNNKGCNIRGNFWE